MNSRTPEAALPVVEEPPAEGRKEPAASDPPGAGSFRFDDPYWDEVFDSYHDPTLGTCCRY